MYTWRERERETKVSQYQIVLTFFTLKRKRVIPIFHLPIAKVIGLIRPVWLPRGFFFFFDKANINLLKSCTISI